MSIKSNSTMGFTVYLELDESEAKALKAITTFSSKDFLEVFYKSLGRSNLEPNEAGLISLFEKIRKELPAHIDRIEKTREFFKNNNPNK